MKIAFIWQGSSKPEIFNWWNDGLRVAMRIIEKTHTVTYHEPWDDVSHADVLLYWEAPCTINGGNSSFYEKVRHAPQKKILLFAGGPLKKEWVEGFDFLAIESDINMKECEEMGIPHFRAFGINDEVFKYVASTKQWDGIHHATSASWKRQWLMAEALKEKCLVVGRPQPEDMEPFERSKALGAEVRERQHTFKEVADLIRQSHTLCQTASYWGGGQRATLEAMACGVPVIAMSDSPKNCEFVQESGFGMIVDPNPSAIRSAVEHLKSNPLDPKIGVKYVKSKWTGKKYAEALLAKINTL
jgi:glycosyltransferase involved in cell wall biosynthesis